MAYDEDLADRVRELVYGQSEGDVGEQPMFGGLAFLVDGNMAFAVSGQGGLLVRLPPNDTEGLVGSATGAEAAVMGGRKMRGWLRVGPEHLRTEKQLAPWVQRGLDYARSLPAKGGKRWGR